MKENTDLERLATENSELHLHNAELQTAILVHEKNAESLSESELRYRRLFESAKDGILILDEETGKIVDANPFLLNLLGYTYEAVNGQYIWELGVFKDIAASKEAFKTLQDNEYIRYEDLPLETKEGKPISVEFVSNVYLVDHTKVIQCNIRDITARKHADAEHKQLMAAIEQTGEAIIMTDIRGSIQYVNPAFERITGYTRDEVLGNNPRILKSDVQDGMFFKSLWGTLASGNTWSGRIVNKRKDGTLYTEETTISPVRDEKGRTANYVAVQRDISDDLRLAAQFQQAQKMEAVGLLAGGVAHDYNNMLSVIIGYTEMALKKVRIADPLHGDLEHIYNAAKRSTDITRQLLAFARKQTIVPVVLDLNQNVESMLSMIRRLIGEDIDLSWMPDGSLYPILMDPAQVDQILANLCVNARDAITDVGKVIIETENKSFDASYCALHAGYVPGEYAMLAVSDDGCGMDKAMVEQIFEPFFTSKGVGEGTGLGLSTVYGIVKQNNGFINVYSEVGKGTTFKIYLPRCAGEIPSADTGLSELIVPGHGETVLLVEDEPGLMKLTKMMLEEIGYRVIAAGLPGEAIIQAGKHADEIRLLLTDVVMPEMNGRGLAEHLRFLYPAMKFLFMSGYTADVIAHRGVLDQGVNFIQKPFSMKDLALKVRDAMQSA